MIQRRRKPSHSAIARSVASILESLESRQLLSAAVEIVSLASNGDPADAQSPGGVISSDGRYVAFESTATNLVPGDNNGFKDLFLRDMQLGTTTRITMGYDGTSEPDQNSSAPAISADGRFVAFVSSASNLVSNDTNNVPDVFLWDRNDGSIRRISVASDGTQANSDSSPPSISADGRYVTYHSNASNLVANDTNGFSDVFLFDTQTNTTTLVSTNTGSQGNGSSTNPAISGNGRFVAFFSNASNFVAAGADTNNFADVFVWDSVTRSLQRVSVSSTSASNPTGTQGNGAAGQRLDINSDGTVIAFESAASNLVANDTNGKTDIFVVVRSGSDLSTLTTSRVSVGLSGASGNGDSTSPSISDNGRYIVFESTAFNLVANDTNNTSDVFVYDRSTSTTSRVSTGPLSLQANFKSNNPAISGNGRFVAFFSNADNLLTGQLDGNSDIGDVFVRDLQAAPAATVSGTPDGSNPTNIPAGDTTPTAGDGTDFGLLDIADPALVHTFTITNTGSDRLLLTGANPVTISGVNAGDFTVVSQPSVTSLDPGASTTFTVRFDPSAPGIHSAVATLASNDPSHASYSFTLKGVGYDSTVTSRLVVTQQSTTISPSTPYYLGSIPLAKAAGDDGKFTFTVMNVSNQILTLVTPTLTFDTPTGVFTVSSDLAAKTLAPGETTTFTIALTDKAAVGTVSSTVNIANTGSDTQTLSFNVTGSVTIPHIVVSVGGNALTPGQTQSLGSVFRNTTTPTDTTFTITNSGQAPLVLNFLTIPAGFAIGSNGSNISLDSTHPSSVSVAPNSSVTFSVHVTPAATAGDKAGDLVISSSDPTTATFTVHLTGTVTVPAAAVSVDGAAVNTGATVGVGTGVLGQTGPTKTFTISNSGPAPLNISNVVTGTAFTVVSKPTAAIASGQSATIVIRLLDSSAGAVTGNSLSFSTDDPANPTYTFSLTANVLAQPLTVLIDGSAAAGQTIPFGTLPQSATPVTKTITLRNDGVTTINLLGTPVVPRGFTLASAPSTTNLAPGASATFSISFTPLVSGAQSGILSVPTDYSSLASFTLGLTASVTPAAKTSLGIDSISLSKVPAIVIGGIKTATGTATGTATVVLNNYSTVAVSGSYKITLYASAGLVPIAGQDKVLGTQTVKVNLRAKAKVSQAVKLTFPAPPANGSYNILAVITGPKIDPFYGLGRVPYTVRIEKPLASIGATPGSSTGTISGSLGKSVNQTVTFTNSGNQPLTGTLTGDIYLSKDGSLTNATKVTTLSGLKIGNLKPKASQKVKVTFTLPKTLPSGYAATGSYTLIFKLTKITSTTPNSIPNDGLVPAGKIALK